MLNEKAKNVILTVVVGLPLAIGVSYTWDHINVTTSESLDHRVFWRTSERPGPGDYASFLLTHELAGPEPVLISKKLACWGGQETSQQGREFFCDGEPLGRAKTKTLTGKALPLFAFSGPIPAGKAWAYGSHPDSFDSRYWGLVDVSAAKRLKAIF